MKKPPTPSPAICLVLALSACSLTPRQPPALHDFGPPSAAPIGGIQITVTAPPWLQDTRLRYRLLYQDPTRVRFYAHHRWIAPPPLLLAHSFATPSSPFYRLRVYLLDFEQVFDTPSCSRIVLRFWAEAIQGDLVAARLFSFDQVTPSASVQGALATYAKVVAEAAERLRTWLGDIK